MRLRISQTLTLAAGALLLIVISLRPGTRADGKSRAPAAGLESRGPLLEQGDYPLALGRAVQDVLREHRFNAPWIAVRGSDRSTWFVGERIESAHRFDRLYLRVPAAGRVTASITPYQFGPSDWASLGPLFADFGPEAKEIAAAIGEKGLQ